MPPKEPLTPEEQAQEEQRQTYEQRVSTRREMTPEELTRAILEEWESVGIDKDDPDVISFASSPLIQNAYKNNEIQFKAFTQTATEKFSARATSDYYQALDQFNLSTYEFPEPEPTAAGEKLVRRKFGRPSELPREFLKGRGPYIEPNTGAVYYPNGVIVDSNTGQVFYPPSGEIAGSGAWRNKGRESWSDERILKWKTRLVELGYLPKEAMKTAEWNTSFDDALRDYFTSKYQNFGQVLPLDEAAGGFGPGGGTFSNLQKIRATIETGIVDQYQRLFGVEPTEGELKEWTKFVIREGNKLQRGPHGLASGTAAVEAQAEARRELETSPGAVFLRESQEENTRMRDALEQAVIVTNSLAS